MIDSTSIVFAPLLPWAALIVLFAVAGVIVLYAIVRRARGAWWRLFALSVLALALLNPSLVQEKREPIKDVAVVVVDESPSQLIGERKARTERALTDLQDKLSRFDDLDVRIVRTGSEGIDETHLFDALNRTLADVPRRRMAGAVLLTDGQVHDVPGNTRELAEYGPIHTLLSGTKDEVDRRLNVVRAPTYGIVGKEVEVTIKVADLPEVEEALPATLTVRRNGGSAREYPITPSMEQTFSFMVEHGGQNVFEFEVNAIDDELTLTNNRAAVVVNGVRDRLRVLLVSGEPHAGERTWRNLLKADPSVDLVHFTILRPPEKQDGTPIRELSLIAFPIRELFEVKLEEFDLIIFDRYRRLGVLPQIYLENIARYVEQGGAFLEASGPGYESPLSLYRTPLGDILPGEPVGDMMTEPFKPAVTELGQKHPVTAGLTGDPSREVGDWGRWFRQIDVDARSGSIVMTGIQDRPLLILDRIGKGRVAQLASDHIWLWSRGFEGGGPQAELLRRIAHWLMKEPELEEDSLRTRVDGNRITIERRTMQDQPSASVQVTTPSGNVQTVPLDNPQTGLSTATITAAEPGIFRISDGSKTTLAVVGATNPPELSDVRTTEERLAPAAKATNGGILWLNDLQGAVSNGPDLRRTRPDRDQSGSRWIGLRSNGDYIVTGVDEVPLLPVAAVLILALGTLIGAWRREGK